MWTRAELKERAKAAFKRNYWVCVAAALILSLLVGGSTSGGSSSGSSSSDTDSIESIFSDETDELLSDDYGYSEYEEDDIFGDLTQEDKEMLAVLGVAGGVILVIILVALVIGLVFGIFVSSVIEIGGCRFFTLNATQDVTSLKELFSGFGSGNYMRNVSTQFFRGLYTFLWSLLFLIPGIIKGYEYMMIPYILADNPDISKEDAFALSKRMMDGHKWNAFVLDLSFLGWVILNVFTCGILGVFYVDPYIRATNAELYLKLKSNVIPVQTIADDQYVWDGTQRI